MLYLFSFSFVLLAVTDASLLFWIVLPQIQNHVLSTVNEDGLQFLVWTISYNHCHVLCCYFHNNRIFLVYKIYKIKNIIIFIFDQTFLICYRLFLIRWKLVSKFQYHFPQTFWGVFIQIVKLIVGIILPSAIVCVCVCMIFVWMECIQSVCTNFILQLHHYFWDGFLFVFFFIQ